MHSCMVVFFVYSCSFYRGETSVSVDLCETDDMHFHSLNLVYMFTDGKSYKLRVGKVSPILCDTVGRFDSKSLS